MVANFGTLGSVVAIGVIFLLAFAALRLISGLLSAGFIGLCLSLVSYFVYDYIFATVPVVAAIAFACSLCGLSSKSVAGKVVAVFGLLISGYIILRNYGILV